MSWKPNTGWLVRTKTSSGAEGKSKYNSYQEASVAAYVAINSGGYRDVWIQENTIVPVLWRDLDPTKKPKKRMEDRAHVVDIDDD